MSKIICSYIDYVFAEGIALIIPAGVHSQASAALKPGYAWTSLQVKERPAYSSEIRNDEAGPLREETVTAVTRSGADPFLMSHIAFPVVLRMHTDDRVFYVGSDRYPCTVEASTDGISDTYSFAAASVPLEFFTL